MMRARALRFVAAALVGGAWLVACVPPLPGGALDGAASGGKGGASSAGNAGRGGAPGKAGAPGAAGTGFGGANGGPIGSGAFGAPPILAGAGGAAAGSAGAGGDGMPVTCDAPRCTPQSCMAPPPSSTLISGFESACNGLEPVD